MLQLKDSKYYLFFSWCLVQEEHSQEYKSTVIVVIDTYDQCEFIIWLYLLH